MSLATCAGCVVVLHQQQEQNSSHAQQFQDEPIQRIRHTAQGKTVVENGKVVVKVSI